MAANPSIRKQNPINTTIDAILNAIDTLKEILRNQEDDIKELKQAVVGYNGIPGLVSDMRDTKTIMTGMGEKLDEIYSTGCKFGQSIHHTPHTKTRADDKVTFKWITEQLIKIIPYAIIGFMYLKYFQK